LGGFVVTGQERFGWPVLRQLRARDLEASSDSAISPRTRQLTARTSRADKVVKSICPYCAVGCGQNVHVAGDTITNIEGDPDSPISRGRLCPKGAATYELVTGPHRQTKVLYRRPRGTSWEVIELGRAMDMVADRVKAARDATWEDKSKDGLPLRRTMSIAHLGGATLDNEENYLIKKLFTALGAVQIENQARI
jgi:formate dehydrogenase major subunit